MSERAAVFENLQLGVEATPGTLVPGNRRGFAFNIVPNLDIPSSDVNVDGSISPIEQTNAREMTTAALAGNADFVGLAYLLSSVVGQPTPKWTITLTGASSGTFSVTFRGQTAAGNQYNVSAANLKTALEALSTIGVGNVTVSLTSLVYTIVIFVPGNLSAAAETINAPVLCAVTSSQQTVTPVSDDAWIITLGTQSSGNFVVRYRGVSSANILYNANAATVKTAIDAMSSVGANNVVVTGSAGGPYTITPVEGFTRGYPFYGVDAGLTTPANLINSSTAGTLTRRWNFCPPDRQPESPITYTVEHGSEGGTLGDRFGYGLLHEMEIVSSDQRGQISISGAMFGQQLDETVSATPNPTDLTPIMILPAQCSAYLSSDGITWTKFTRCFEWRWNLRGRTGPVFVADEAQTSFATHVNLRPDSTAMITVSNDTTAQSLLAAVRARSKRYLRIVVNGITIEGNYKYRFILTIPARVRAPQRAESQGVESMSFTFRPTNDPTWGGWMDIVLDNTINAL